jgi:hypothetical protein
MKPLLSGYKTPDTAWGRFKVIAIPLFILIVSLGVGGFGPESYNGWYLRGPAAILFVISLMFMVVVAAHSVDEAREKNPDKDPWE